MTSAFMHNTSDPEPKGPSCRPSVQGMEQTQHPSLQKRVLFLLVDKHDDRTEVGIQQRHKLSPACPSLLWQSHHSGCSLGACLHEKTGWEGEMVEREIANALEQDQAETPTAETPTTETGQRYKCSFLPSTKDYTFSFFLSLQLWFACSQESDWMTVSFPFILVIKTAAQE